MTIYIVAQGEGEALRPLSCWTKLSRARQEALRLSWECEPDRGPGHFYIYRGEKNGDLELVECVEAQPTEDFAEAIGASLGL